MSKATSIPLLAAALLLACTDRPLGGSATEPTGTTGGATATTTTTAATTTTEDGPEPVTSNTLTDPEPPTSTSGPTSETATSVADTGSSASGGIPDFVTEAACDIWSDDCPAGQKCMPVSLDGDNAWESLRCVPLAPNPDGLNDPCELLGTGLDGLDTCDIHQMCWDVDPDTGQGTCLGLCTGSPDNPDCADPEAICNLTAEGVLNLCLPTCDPLAMDCPPGDVCVPVPAGGFFCAPDAGGDEGQVFDPCEFINVCDPGLVCVVPDLAAECDPMQAGCCLPFCDVTQPNTCPGVGLECLVWWGMGQAPPGLEHVGVCGEPP